MLFVFTHLRHIVSRTLQSCCAAWVSNVPSWKFTRRPLFRYAAAICMKRRYCKWRLTDKRRMKKLENRHIHDCITLIFIVQKETQWGERRAVLRLFPYSSATVSGEKSEMKKKRHGRKCHGGFLRAGAFSRERTGIIVFFIVRTFASTVLFAQFPLCRR